MKNLYAVRDVKADSYIALYPVDSDVLAQRSLSEALQNPNSDLSRYPEDYQLYQVGTWEPNTGEVAGLRAPRFVCSAMELVQAVCEREFKRAQDKAAFDKRFAAAQAGEVAK